MTNAGEKGSFLDLLGVASLPTWEELKNLEISLLLFFYFERCPDILSTERAQPYKEGRYNPLTSLEGIAKSNQQSQQE